MRRKPPSPVMLGARRTWDFDHAPCLQELWKRDVSFDGGCHTVGAGRETVGATCSRFPHARLPAGCRERGRVEGGVRGRWGGSIVRLQTFTGTGAGERSRSLQRGRYCEVGKQGGATGQAWSGGGKLRLTRRHSPCKRFLGCAVDLLLAAVKVTGDGEQGLFWKAGQCCVWQAGV